MKKHGCMITYLLYVVLFLIYFFFLGKLLSSLQLKINSDDLLAVTLFLSFVLAFLTALVIANWKRISGFLASIFRR